MKQTVNRLRNWELTEAQKRYEAFDRRRLQILVVILIFLVVIIAGFIVGAMRAEEDGTLLLVFFCLSVVYEVIVFFICRKMRQKQEELYPAAYGNDWDVVHTGLFGEIWESFDAAPYGAIAGGKVEYMETCNNTIELEILRNGHVFHGVIDPEGLYIVVDEEEETFREMEIPLSEIQNAEQFFAILEKFIRENS